MPIILTEKPSPYETIPNRIRWTRKQCDMMQDAGLLTERYELINGEIISKMGQKPPHAFVITALLTWLSGLFGIEYTRIQSTIDLSEISPDYDEPEPDVAVTLHPYTHYPDRHPGSQDLLLLVEVSDTTLRFDRTTKATLYARAAIREYWIVDVIGRQILVHRRPEAEEYSEITAYLAEESVSTLARPETPVRVADLLPPIV